MDDMFEMNLDQLRQMQGMVLPPMGMNQFGVVDPFERMDRFDPFRRRRQAPQAAQEVKDAKLLVQDLGDLVNSMKKKSQNPELKRMEEKLEALQRSLDRIEQRSGR